MIRIMLLVLLFLPQLSMAGSRVLATSALNTIEGNGGGGISPWATISGYSSDDEWSFTLNKSHLQLDDFDMDSHGFSLSYDNWLELSYAKQKLQVIPLSADVEMEAYGFKARVFGDLIYDSAPQIAIGAVHKKNNSFAIPSLLGAAEDSSTDFYVAASKLFLDGPMGYNWLVNVTARNTKANQNGLLGFGDLSDNNKTWVGEASVAFMPSESVAIGVEYRQQPNQLASVKEDAWKDFFVAWFINKNISLTAAYVDTGTVAGLPDQDGVFINLQGYF